MVLWNSNNNSNEEIQGDENHLSAISSFASITLPAEN